MVFGQYPPLTQELSNPVWERAFSWISEHVATLPDGEHEISGRDMYANIHTATLVSIADAVYEVHQQYIDLHYCISGGEGIGHSPQGHPKEKTSFDNEKDYQLFFPSQRQEVLEMTPSCFAIFFPGELHMPKLRDGRNETVRKVVVKIKASLL